MANSYWSELDIVCGSTREWIYYISDMVHILEQTASLCRYSEHFNVDILSYWMLNGSQDTEKYRYFVLLDAEWITGYRHCVFLDAEQISGQTAEYSG